MAMPVQPPGWGPPPAGMHDDVEHANRRKFKNDVWLANYYIITVPNAALAAQYVRAMLSAGSRLAPGWLSPGQIAALNVFRAAWPNNPVVYQAAITQLNNDLIANLPVY
jgi:hypothetical protein